MYLLRLYDNGIVVLIVMISVLFAGLSSEMIFGLRAVDYLLVGAIFILLLLGVNVKKNDAWELFVFLLLIVFGLVIGVYRGNAFVLSDLRTYFSIFASLVLASQLKGKINYAIIKKSYYCSLIIVFVIYFIASHYESVQWYYVPYENIVGKEMEFSRVFGPSLTLITFLFILLVYSRKQGQMFYLHFLLASIIFYGYHGTRHVLIMMFTVLFLAYIYRYGYARFIVLVFPIIVFVVIFVLGSDGRLMNVLNPFDDTSFMYRVISNEYYLKEIVTFDIVYFVFGMGFGATIDVWMGKYLGMISMVILDNGFLTYLMKSGLVGLFLIVAIVYVRLNSVNVRFKAMLFIPLLFSSIISAHILTHFVYLFGFVFSINYLTNAENQDIEMFSDAN